MNPSCSIHIRPYKIPNSNISSCLDIASLRRIADSYNHKMNKIIILYDQTTTQPDLWLKIDAEMNKKCKKGDELCWIDTSGVDATIEKEHFKPKKPKGKYTWLSNIDIEQIMYGQQQKHAPYFKFYGPVPSDFDVILTELSGVNLKDMPEVRKVGIITNLDPHYKSGSHWTAFFMDLDAQTIEYFDSLGEKPFNTMKEYINNLKAWLRMNYNIDAKIKINKKVFQKKYDGDCGIWSVWYIIQRLNGNSFDDIVKMNFAEEKLNKCRDAYFRK